MATYINLRVGLATLAIALPFILWPVGYLLFGVTLEDSMSDYYHAGDGAMRNVFVGVLIAVGAFLYLYKGFTWLENIWLNAAGLFLVGVALFPVVENSREIFTLHGAFAVLFFLCIAYVCMFRATDTLSLIQDQTKVERYKRVYRGLGLGMIASPVIAFVLTSLITSDKMESNPLVFFIEAVGIIVFGTYWITKSREIAVTNAERQAMEGKLSTPQLHVTDAFNPTTIDQAQTQEP